MLSTPPLLFASQDDVAILVGGGNDAFAEYQTALELCMSAGKNVVNFVCNDALSCFPGIIHHACTLHPDKWTYWNAVRTRGGHPPVQHLWSHRSYPGFHYHTKDWQGSSGLFMCKVARELGHTHIIGCGIPMTIEGGHFARDQQWNAAPGFRRGWARVQGSLKPFLRSMSGWTKEHFGLPDAEWLNSIIPDPHPMKGKFDHTGVTA